MQEVFGTPGGDWFAPRFAEIVPNVVRLVKAYGSRVVFTRYVAPAEPRGAWVPYFQDWPFALQPPDSPLWDIVPALAEPARAQQAAGIGPVTATTFTKWGTQLATLVGHGPMILTGVATDCCVVSTALPAADAGMETWVVREAVAAGTDEGQVRAIDLMDGYAPLIRVVGMEQALAAAA